LESLLKIPLLPETDLARIAPQPIEHKRNALEAFRLSFPPYSYLPLRKSLADVLNAQTGFLPAGERVPFQTLAKIIDGASRSEAEYEANLRVAEGLYNEAVAKEYRARKQEFFPLNVGVGSKISYWHSFILNVAGEPLVPFFDPRRGSTNLTALGRRFAFSVMHQRIRVADPDYANVRLGIFQFTVPEKGPRVPKLFTDQGVALFSFDELEAMVRETYEIWTEVYLQRTDRERKRGRG
jgi:hypothetical protein